MYASFIEDMKENYHLKCYAIGGKMPNLVEEIGANFVLVKHTSQEEARKLLTGVTRRLLQMMNQSTELRPHLVEYPFPSKRLKIRISFTTSDHHSYYDGSMQSMTLEKDKITYYKIPPEDELAVQYRLMKKSYQNAERTVEELGRG